MFADAMPLPVHLVAATEADTGRRAPQSPMNEAKFEAFYRRNAGSLWSYLYRLTSDPSAADDLLQKTFYRFIRANPETESDEHTRRYLFRTATNLTFDHFRDTKRERDVVAMDRDASSLAENVDLRHDMTRVFSELKPRERAILWLAHVEESSHDEIGRALGVKSRSVRVLLFRARRRLADVLRKYGLAPKELP
ncbi:MAG: RNA polymerase sigma factor [Thermoanaerobaculia bacterium]